ncbi:MAG: hypothetical protein U5P41_07430 [Gammaproteobacteria bacterium]|nr:hypothetical protein [Gammaproteobacteria bacterium]
MMLGSARGDMAPPSAGTYVRRAAEGSAPAGERATKAMEKWLRGQGILPDDRFLAAGYDAPLDRFGNVQRRVLRQAFEQLGNLDDPLARRGPGGASGKRSRGWRYFVVVRDGVPNGIFRARGRSRQAQSVVIFTKRPRYQQRLEFDETIQQIYNREFGPGFDRRLQRELNERLPR